MNFWSILLSGGVLGFVFGALAIGAHAYDQGFRAGTSWGLWHARPQNWLEDLANKVEETADA